VSFSFLCLTHTCTQEHTHTHTHTHIYIYIYIYILIASLKGLIIISITLVIPRAHMELQLGLALSTAEEFKSKQIVSSELWRPSCGSESGKHVKHKRNFEESFQRFLKPFPLLVWSGQPNEEDDRSQKLRRNIHTPNK